MVNIAALLSDAPTDADIDNGPIAWVQKFRETVRHGSISDIANHFCQMGVEATSDSFNIDWLKKNQKRYNRVIWLVIQSVPGLRLRLRRFLLRDLKKTHPDLREEFGDVFHKPYARDLLEHFLRAKPSPDWVDS